MLFFKCPFKCICRRAGAVRLPKLPSFRHNHSVKLNQVVPLWTVAQPDRLFQHRVEYRGEIAGRGIDDAQDLGSGGLLLQGLARLGQQPRVLHRDHRLSREIFQKRDLFSGLPGDRQ